MLYMSQMFLLRIHDGGGGVSGEVDDGDDAPSNESDC